MTHATITDALRAVRSPIDAAAFTKLACIAGLIERREYVSGSGTGEIKDCWALTAAGLAFGVNKPKYTGSNAVVIKLDPALTRQMYAVVIAGISLPDGDA